FMTSRLHSSTLFPYTTLFRSYHVNANRPLGKYAIPTSLKIDAPRGVNIGPVIYPRAIVRRLKAVNNEPLAVYEGRAILRFSVTVDRKSTRLNSSHRTISYAVF